jgi:hypothetical protein
MRTVRRNPIPYFELNNTLPNAYHPANVTISERQWLAQFAEYGIQRWDQAIGFNLIGNHFYQFGLKPGFLQQISLAEFNQHSFRTERDQAPGSLNEYLPGGRYRGRHIL